MYRVLALVLRVKSSFLDLSQKSRFTRTFLRGLALKTFYSLVLEKFLEFFGHSNFSNSIKKTYSARRACACSGFLQGKEESSS